MSPPGADMSVPPVAMVREFDSIAASASVFKHGCAPLDGHSHKCRAAVAACNQAAGKGFPL